LLGWFIKSRASRRYDAASATYAGKRLIIGELKERDEKDANAELTYESQRPQQQQRVLKGSQRALKQSANHIITVGLKDIQNRMLQTDFKGMTSRPRIKGGQRLERGHLPRRSKIKASR
jgi:hypothetical protein